MSHLQLESKDFNTTSRPKWRHNKSNNMENEEQLEAKEINEKIRIVITPENFYIFGPKGSGECALTLDKDALLSMMHLQEVLGRHKLES